MFGGGTFGTTSLFGASAAASAVTNVNPMKDIEVPNPPDDTISALAFSPATLPATYLAAGSWDNNVQCFTFFYFFYFNMVDILTEM